MVSSNFASENQSFVYKSIFFSALLLMLIACHEKVYDNFTTFEQVPVISGFIANEGSITVHVSLTSDINKNPLQGLDNAKVVVYASGSDTIELVHEGEGLYLAEYIAVFGQMYQCEVSVPGYAVVRATTLMPYPPVLQSVQHTAIAGKDEEGITYPSVSFTFENNPAETMYYEARIRLFRNDEERRASVININDPVLLNEGLPMVLFSNKMIKDNSYTMTINYHTNSSGSFGSNGEQRTTLYPFVLELRAVSHDYYQYARSVYLYETGRYPEFGLHANHVFPLHSNTSSGYGVFAAYASTMSDTIYPSY